MGNMFRDVWTARHSETYIHKQLKCAIIFQCASIEASQQLAERNWVSYDPSSGRASSCKARSDKEV
jgi:hypothetical protein